MQGFKTDYVNLIADNLRDRYDNGFPILKELIQNADDAKARTLIFGRHPGFPDSRQPLLRGPGLWCFNDGEFKHSDAEGLRSFGIGGKAGDADAIGKFGLGMKSVFHLCEALFYVAWDGTELHHEGLTPWKQDGQSLQQDWDETSEADWRRLAGLGKKLAADGGRDGAWFLLWLPLRKKKHLRTRSGQETGAIISRFPGDESSSDLAFLRDEKLAHDMAEVLPLLRHLKRVEHRGEDNRFVVRLADAPRTHGRSAAPTDSGQVLWADGKPRLAFSGRKVESLDTDGRFEDMKTRKEWPRTRYRDELGQEREEKDKASPEGAVLFCSGSGSETSSRLHWAVFLPVEDGSEELGGGHGKRGHSLILHGQFFLDAGRKRIHGHGRLHEDPEPLGDAPIDESRLRRAWNQRLAQEVVLPLVLPTLEDHVRQHRLPDSECCELTEAISKSDWFKDFRKHICRDRVWLRTLEQDAGPKWGLVDGGSRPRLRPFPKPPGSAPDRPWTVFPELAACGVLPYDKIAPCLDLSDRPGKWSEPELERLLSRLDGMFVNAPSMDYVIDFLYTCAGSCLSADCVQSRFLGALRDGLRAAGREERRRVGAKATRLVGFLHSERRHELAADLPESILKDLWGIDAPVLLVPKDLEPGPPGKASPDEAALAAWLGVLDRALDSPDHEEGAHQRILRAAQGLLQTLSAEDRTRFLRNHRTLRVIRVRDVRKGVQKPVSVEDLDRVREAGCLFTFAEGLREAGMGITPWLARAVPGADVCLVQAPTYRELFSEDEAQGGGSLPVASDGRACLAAVGRYTGRLEDIAARRGLLERANDPGTDSDARRGLRFLLHGSPDHRDDEDAKLWIGRHPVWNRLWGVMHKDAQWSLVDGELANTIPRNRWTGANIAEIDARTLIKELLGTGRGIDEPEVFSVEERDEILSCIEDEELWRRLPLHTTLAGTSVSEAREQVYLAPSAGVRDGHEDPLTREAILIAPSQNVRVSEQQKHWLPPLDDRARIEIALDAVKPDGYWLDIMDALGHLSIPLEEDTQRRLRNTAWLPTTHHEPAKPEDVIDLPEGLCDEAHRLVAEHRKANGPCFAVPDDLEPAMRDHGAWWRLREVCFSSGNAGLEHLGLLLEDLPNYRIGKWKEPPRTDVIGLLARYDGLPGWRLLETVATDLSDSEAAWDQLGPALSRAIEPQRLAAVLDWLSGDNDQWDLRKPIYDGYLHQLVTDDQAAVELPPGLRLASEDGRWRPAAELCAGTPGVAQDRLLDRKQESILGKLVYRAELDPTCDQPIAPQGDHQHEEASRTLRDYFEAWGANLVPRPMIGVVLALLGSDVRKLADEYLHPHSFDWLVKKLPWNDPGGTQGQIRYLSDRIVADARESNRMDEAPREIVLNIIQAVVRVETGEEVNVRNLLGNPIRVTLDANPSTLLAGPPESRGGREVIIRFRSIAPERFDPERLSTLLRATAEWIDSDLYLQNNENFGSLWQELDKSDQLEIGIARRLILDHIPFYLRQLSVRSELIQDLLASCDSFRRRIAEAEAGKDAQSAESAKKEERQALDKLAECIDRNPDDRQAVLQAVKSKLEQYQYDPSSIPLELFQNADDAGVELGQCHAYLSEGSEVPKPARRFVVEEREDGLGFLHWGRPINYRGPVGFGGEGRGYDRDLEKMLILSATDKPGDESVTGKFGLGFKSVLLACEQPRILSGRLAIRVVAGILPQPWEDAQEARQRLAGLGSDSRQPGTLIDLPGVEGETRARVLERFRQLAGILCVFGRAVRYVTHVSASGSSSSWSWVPQEVCPGVEVGDLHLQSEWGACTKALCIRTGDGDLLMALGPQGFRPLPGSVPALWVTAPTRESSAVGFAVNGSFDLDAGRGRLAGDADKNLEKAKRIGRQAGDALGPLLERSHEEWSFVRAALGLVANLDALDFWESVWFGLTKGWLGRPRHDVEELARESALGVLVRLCKRRHAVPNGLKGSLRSFSDARGIRYELTGVLLREDVGGELGAWERFTKRYPASLCASGEIGSILRAADLCRPRPLDLSALAGLLERSRVEPADAEVLGRLWLLPREEKDWELPDIRNQLNGLLFRSEAGEWTEAHKLLAARGPLDSDDEPRRHELAPPEFRLHADYYVERDEKLPAIAFFLACRRRMEASAEMLAQWVLAAESVEERYAALVYLADGELGEQVAERVRERGWLPPALYDPELMDRLTEDKQHKLRRRLIPSSRLEQAVSEGGPSGGQSTPIDARIGMPTALDRIYEWWSKERHELAGKYRNRLYPQDVRSLDLTQDPETGRIDRSSWFTLLALGSFQGMGRTLDEQHRGFVRHCQEQGWWEIFTENDPKEEPEKWMDIIEEYAEGQHDDEEWMQWMGQFPKLYRLRRWLDDYVALLLSMDGAEEPFTLDTILAPRSDSRLQGGGIDAPPLTRTLKLGVHLVVRELLYHDVIENSLAIPHAYAPIGRIKGFFEAFGTHVETSENIHEILTKHLGEERAAFCGDYDIPLRIISSDDSLRCRLLGR